jgi:hypothetical protein
MAASRLAKASCDVTNPQDDAFSTAIYLGEISDSDLQLTGSKPVEAAVVTINVLTKFWADVLQEAECMGHVQSDNTPARNRSIKSL